MIKRIFEHLRAFQELIAMAFFYVGWLSNPLQSDLLIQYSEAPYFLAGNGEAGAAPEILTISLRNRSSSNIASIELRLNGIKSVTQSGAFASFNRFDPAAAAAGKLQPDDAVYFFEGFKEIPPGHHVEIQVIAKAYQLIVTPRLKVTSDAKTTRINKTGEVGGFLIFIDEHSEFLFIVLVVAAALLGGRRLLARREK